MQNTGAKSASYIHRLQQDGYVAADPVGQLPEELVEAVDPILDFVSISAVVAAPPRHKRAPQAVHLTVKFSGGQSASWQRSLEDVSKAATHVWQQLSEV